MLSRILGVPSPPNPDSLTDFQKIPFAKLKNELWTAQDGGNPITIWGVIVLGTGFLCPFATGQKSTKLRTECKNLSSGLATDAFASLIVKR